MADARKRDGNLAESTKSPKETQVEARKVLNRKKDPSTAVSTVQNSAISREQLALFRGQSLEASGDIFIKPSKFQRAKKHHAELRGSTIVIFRSSIHAQSGGVDIQSVVLIILVLEYHIDVVQKDGGDPRIYIRPKVDLDNSSLYIKVAPGSDELDSWRNGLARVMNADLPTLNCLTVESVIGRGGGGKVFVVHWKKKDMMYALKVIDKTDAFKSTKSFLHVASERYLMEKAGKHPFLLPLKFAFQTETKLFIGTPFCSGGDLASYIRQRENMGLPVTSLASRHHSVFHHRVRKTSGRLSEAETKPILCEIILGIETLHSLGIVYRDLKPENIFIDGSGHIQIGDYGLAKHLPESKTGLGRVQTASLCGTRNYLPPEMLFGRLYSFQADLWCLGILMYRMIVGDFPFDAARTRDLFHKVKRYEPQLPAWLSCEASSLLTGLLQKDPIKRLTMRAVKEHPFFKTVKWNDVLLRKNGPSVPDVDVGSSVSDALENFDMTKLQSISFGKDVLASEELVGIDRSSPTSLDKMMIGFEISCPGKDEDLQPLIVTQKSRGLFSKLSSLDYEQFSLSPKRTSTR